MNYAKQLPYHNKEVLIKQRQDVSDIVKAMLTNHEANKSDYDKISDNFWKGNPEATAKFLFDFLKKNIKYKIEPDAKQTVKSPGAFLNMGYGDCKHYASFIQGILDSLRRKGYPIDSRYRFASYKISKPTPHHVFVVMNNNGKETWIDPVLRGFDEKKMYWYGQDEKTNTMAGVGALYSISGVGARGARRAKRLERRAKKAAAKGNTKKAAKLTAKKGKVDKRVVRRTARKAKRKAKGPLGKRILQKVKKYNPAFVAGRNSFLTLLKINAFRIASKMYAKSKTNPEGMNKLKAQWQKLGGNPSVLEKNIKQGVAVWNKHHPDKRLSGDDARHYDSNGLNRFGWDKRIKKLHCPGSGIIHFEGKPFDVITGIGAEPISTAALLASALPVIAAMAAALRELGVNPDNIQQEAENEYDEAEQELFREEGEDYDDSQDYEEEEDFGEDEYYGEDDFIDEEIGFLNFLKRKPGKRPIIRLRKQQPGEKRALVTLKRAPGKQPLIRLRKTKPGEQRAKIQLRKKPKVYPAAPPVIRKTATGQKVIKKPGMRAIIERMTDGSKRMKIVDAPGNNVRMRPGTDEPFTDRDSGGTSDFFSTVKDFANRNRDGLIITGVSIVAVPLLYNLVKSIGKPKKRRR